MTVRMSKVSKLPLLCISILGSYFFLKATTSHLIHDHVINCSQIISNIYHSMGNETPQPALAKERPVKCLVNEHRRTNLQKCQIAADKSYFSSKIRDALDCSDKYSRDTSIQHRRRQRRKLLAISDEEDPESLDSEDELEPDDDALEEDYNRKHRIQRTTATSLSAPRASIANKKRVTKSEPPKRLVKSGASEMMIQTPGGQSRFPKSPELNNLETTLHRPIARRSSVEYEEQKVRNATLHLVMWLRDQLREKLVQIVDMETNLSNFEHLFETIRKHQDHMSSEREKQIRKKLHSQKLLADYRRKESEPGEELQNISNKTDLLESQLSRLGQEYQALMKTRSGMHEKLHRAGFSHWLDARGKRYIPATAAGVLSKSAEILDPVFHGIEKAMEIDNALAMDVDRVLPLGKSALIVGIISDSLLLAIILPLLFLCHRLSRSMSGCSLVQYLFYLSSLFFFQSLLCLVISICLREDVLRHLQETRGTLLTVALFLTAVLYGVFLLYQGVLTMLCPSKSNTVQLAISVCCGYQFYTVVMKPLVLDQIISFPVGMYGVYAAVFLYTLSEKSNSIDCAVPYKKQLQSTFSICFDWIMDTVDAMRSVLNPKQDQAERGKLENAEILPPTYDTCPRTSSEVSNFSYDLAHTDYSSDYGTTRKIRERIRADNVSQQAAGANPHSIVNARVEYSSLRNQYLNLHQENGRRRYIYRTSGHDA